MSSWRILIAGVAAIAMLGLTSCGRGGGGGGPQSDPNVPPEQPPPSEQPLPSEATEFSFNLSSYETAGGAGALTGALSGTQAAGVRHIEGQLLPVPQGHEDERETLTFEIEVDESALEVRTVINIELPERTYDFFFLLKAGGRSYGGILHNRLIVGGGVNTINMTLYPIFGGPVDDVEQLRNLSPVVVRYDPDVLAGYTRPRIGVSLDGGPEQLFDVRVNADDPEILLFPPPGPHTIRVRFFDGAIVKDVTPDTDPVQIDPDSGPTEVNTVPLTTEVNYTYTPGTPPGGMATFDFTVPVDVIAEVGGADSTTSPLADRLRTVVSFVGPENPLSEQTLVLTAVTDGSGHIVHYAGTATVDGFVPGKVTWQISFVDQETQDEFGYCAQTVDTTDTSTLDAGSFVCDLNLLVRTLQSTAPTGTVQVTVKDDGGLVPGAVVLIDGKPLGIAGGDSPGEPLGELLAFLKPGTYKLQVQDEVVDPFGSGQVYTRTSTAQKITIAGDTTTAVVVTLPDFQFSAPTVTGTSVPDGTVDVPVDTAIAVTFSHAMDRTSTQAALRINGAVPTGSYGWSAGDTVMMFTPAAALGELNTYAVTVLGTALDTYQTPLGTDFSFSFTTGTKPDTLAPSVRAVAPADGTGGVDIGTAVTVTFSEPMNTGTAETAFTLTNTVTGNVVPGSYSWSGTNAVLTFLPDDALAYNTSYRVDVADTAQDTAFNGLSAAYASGFTTGEEPDRIAPTVTDTFPTDGAEDLAQDTVVVVTFSEPMDPGTVEHAFLMKQGSAEVKGSFGWNDTNDEVTYTPAHPLAYGKTYVVTISQAALDLAGNALAEPLSLAFRTIEPPPPPPGRLLTVVASRFFRNRDYKDGSIDIDEPITVRIPPLENVQVVRNDETGELIGDPDRFLLFLYLGDVRCMYLAGKWDRHVGGVAEALFKDTFKTPVCNHGNLQANDVITIEPNHKDSSTWSHDGPRQQFFSRYVGRYYSRYGHDDHDDDGRYFDDDDGDRHDDGHDHDGHDHRHHDRAEIQARVITANPHFKETRVQVNIEVVEP